jgi:toxin HigB-1
VKGRQAAWREEVCFAKRSQFFSRPVRAAARVKFIDETAAAPVSTWYHEAINAASRLEDLKAPPANRLEKLKGDLKDFYSIRINDQWRVIFKWVDGEARDVRIIDYH